MFILSSKGRTLKSNDQLLIQTTKAESVKYGDRSFEHAAPVLWNALPLNVRQTETVDIFKRLVKTVLIQRAYDL